MSSLMNGYSTLPVIYKIIFLSFSTHLTSSSNSQLPSEIFPINLKDYRILWSEGLKEQQQQPWRRRSA
ncbi:hypothetical protein Gotur_018935 [Gossypium turneri]